MSAAGRSASASRKAIGSSETLPLVITSGAPASASQQVVQRRVGEHHAQLRRARRDSGGDRRAGAPRREHDRPLGRAQQSPLPRAEQHQRRPQPGGGHHQRERLVLAMLARRSRPPRRRSSARHARWYPPMPLTATIRPAQQRLDRGASGPPPGRRRAVRPQQRQRGPQSEQALGWAWKRRSAGSSYSAWQRGAHLEAGHRRRRPVKGHAADDRESRAAVRAVDERVAVAAVVGVEQLVQAVGAGRGVGRDAASGDAAATGCRRSRTRRGRSARASSATTARPPPAAAPRPAGAPGTARPGVAALDLDQHAARVVQHKPGQPELARQPVDVGRNPTPCTVPSTRTRVRRRPHAHGPRGRPRAGAARGTRTPGLLDPRDVLERLITTWSASSSAATLPPS